MNEKYLLDTDIIIDLIKNKYGLKSKVENVGLVNCYISEITLAELYFGAFYSSSIKKHRKEPVEIAKSFNVIPISEAIELFGKEKARLARDGNIIADLDLFIATTSIVYGCILVTGNEKHHKRVADIRIENWRKPEFNPFI